MRRTIFVFALISCIVTICRADNFISVLTNLIYASEVPERVRTVEEYNRRSNEYVILDFIGLVEKYNGYKAEEYNITTDDGYILRLHRISGSPLYPKTKGKPVVYIQHGLFGSSDFMVLMGPYQSLAFQLADAGYDVWLGNVRGNVYSRSHTNYSAESSSFWNFRMDEMADKDVSKFIDVVLEKTGQTKLTYIGYSMGTTLSYMLLSTKPEYNDKINLLINIAPIAYFSSPVNSNVYLLIRTLLTLGILKNEILTQSVYGGKFAKESCNNSSSSNLCTSFLSYFASSASNLSETAIQDILSYTPAGTSYYTIKHYLQLLESNRILKKYDYGCGGFFGGCKNKDIYNRRSPPEYDISLITVPNIIFYSTADIFVKPQDAEYLKEKLPNVVYSEQISHTKFNHLDFIWSTEAPKLVYNPLLKLLKNFL